MSKNKNKKLLLFAVVAVTVCLSLLIIPAFARYFKQLSEKALRFTYESGNAIYVYSEHITEEDDEWNDFDGSNFVQENDSASLEFSIANGVSREKFANRTQEFSVYLIVGSSIESSNNIEVELSYGDETLIGKPQEIDENNYLYSTSGPGWVYRFYDNDGKERAFGLKGEGFSFENFVLSVKGDVEATLLDLRVVGTYVQTDN